MRKGRERTTAVLAALQEKRGLTEGTLQAMEVEARSRPKGMDEWASAQQGRRGLQVGYIHSNSLLAVWITFNVDRSRLKLLLQLQDNLLLLPSKWETVLSFLALTIGCSFLLGPVPSVLHITVNWNGTKKSQGKTQRVSRFASHVWSFRTSSLRLVILGRPYCVKWFVHQICNFASHIMMQNFLYDPLGRILKQHTVPKRLFNCASIWSTTLSMRGRQ